MMKNPVSAETRMKAAVIDRLLTGGHVTDDSVLISEMTVANWTRRADIVLANGKLCAFELKSEADSLSRLAGQVQTFAAQFEKLIVVVAGRFEAEARAMLPDGVGLWVERGSGCLIERVRPKTLLFNKTAAISLLTVADLRSFLACNGVRDVNHSPRLHLETVAAGFPLSDLANAARNAVKGRYRAGHQAFLKHRIDVGTLDAMRSLRRFSRRPARVDRAVECQVVLPTLTLAEDHPLLINAPAGPVLRRRVNRPTRCLHRA